jgi:carbamate kinase
MRVVVALGGNAILRRGQELNAENQRANIRRAAAELAAVNADHELIIAHGNGPQVGLLALMDAAWSPAHPSPLDILGAETSGMIPRDPAFDNPTKPVGPVYGQREAERLCAEKGWSVARDGEYFRRVVPSPLPQRIIEIDAIRILVENGIVVICAGGGGIPTAHDKQGKLHGVEAVVDKDLAGGLLARDLEADQFIMLTDVPYVYEAHGEPEQRAIRSAHPDLLETLDFASGSMGPKVTAACEFVRATGKISAIGRLSELQRIMQGEAGTVISCEHPGIVHCD